MRRGRNGAFTLVEVLVVMVVAISLAAIVFGITRRIRESALMASNIQNLRSLGVSLKDIESDDGALPLGYNWGTGVSWATRVVESHTSGNALQDRIVLAPTVARSIPPNLKHETISNYAVNPNILPDNRVAGGDYVPRYRVTLAKLLRPQEQVILGDSLPRSTNASHGHSWIIWWALKGGGSGNSNAEPPVANPALAETPIRFPGDILKRTTDAQGYPAYRNRGKCHFLFVDGHVEAMSPDAVKQKHFAISY